MDKEYISIPQLARLLGLSRIAIFKKVRRGEIEAIKIGRNYAISREKADALLGNVLTEANKREIDNAIKKTVREYGQTLKLLGNE